MSTGCFSKKITALFIALAILFSLAACSILPPQSDEAEEPEPVVEPFEDTLAEPEPEPEPEPIVEPEPEPVEEVTEPEPVVEIDRSEGKYPINWDGTKLFADYDAWLAAFESISDYPAKFEKFRGKLNTVDGLLGFIELLYDEDYHEQYDKLLIFAYYGSTAFPGDPLYRKCLAKLDTFDLDYNNAIAYFNEEMGAMTLEKRTSLFKNEKLKKYAFQFRDYLDEDATFYSEDETLLCNTLDISRGRMETLYNIFAYAQMPPVDYTLPDGTVITVDNTSLTGYLRDPDLPVSVKAELYDVWWGNVAEYADTLAYILETEMLEEYASAQVEGYDNTKEWALETEDIPVDVMDRILEAAHNGAARHAEYFQLYADRDGTDQYYSFAEYIPLTDYSTEYISYDDGVDQVLEALSVLGEDYIENLTTVLTSGFVDVYPKEGKSGGAFEWGGFYGLTPFMCFNYDGTFDDVSTIAHEGGHACYDLYTSQNQEYLNWQPGIFTQEVASTVNELLFYNYRINHAASDEEKLYYLGSLLTMWTGTFFRQCFFQEFENYCHETVEAGNALDAGEMTEKWIELSALYYGENYTTGEYGGYRWGTLDHLYYNHYVFKYATSVCYASAIVQAILNEEDGIVENYKDFLKAGNSCTPAEALAMVGIDITTDEAYNNALEYFYSILDEYEELAG